MNFFLQFIRFESVSAILLFIAAIIALLLDNSGLHQSYQQFLHAELGVHFSSISFAMPVLEWVNQGLMSLFFLLVSLEIKREVVRGELKTAKKMVLPIIAALGGMLVPALIYIAFNFQHRAHLQGWAIPTATDIAFSLGILNLLGKRISLGTKVFLTALAIFDDLGAIIIIAFFYTEKISGLYLSLAAVCVLGLLLLNYLEVRKIRWYLLIGLVLWYFVLQSGIHAVLAGVLLAMTIPCGQGETSPLQRLEKKINPYVALLILPIFGLANAGVSFQTMSALSWANLLTLGVAAGLFFGKQIGVFSSMFLAVKMHWAELPQRVNWREVYGISLLCGVGFTMSLFISALAFHQQGPELQAARLGVIAGSLLSGIIGYIWLRYALKPTY